MLQLVEICKSSVEFFLCAHEILGGGRQRLLFVLFFSCLLLDILHFRRLVSLSIRHESVVLSLRRLLGRLGFCFQAGEIRLDHLEHADNTTILCLHALVGRIENFRRLGTGLLSLKECCSLSRFRIKFSEHNECFRHRGLCVLRVLDSLCVFCLFCLANVRSLSHSGVQLGHGFVQFRDLLCKQRYHSLQFVDFSVQGLYGCRFFFCGPARSSRVAHRTIPCD